MTDEMNRGRAPRATASGNRLAAILALAVLGAGVILFLCLSLRASGPLSIKDGGLVAAAFMSLREVVSKLAQVALGMKVGSASGEGS